MKRYFKIYIIVFLILYPLIVFTKSFGYTDISKWLIPLLVTMVFISQMIFNFHLGRIKWLLSLAFLFVCTGDFFINLTSLGQYSVLAFVCTHICLITYYFSENRFQKKDFLLFLPVLILSLLAYFSIFSKLSAFQAIVFAVYLSVLSTMLWRALCYLNFSTPNTRKFLIIAGSFLFYLTDVFVSTNVVFNCNGLVVATWICYPPALLFLSLMNYRFDKH